MRPRFLPVVRFLLPLALAVQLVAGCGQQWPWDHGNGHQKAPDASAAPSAPEAPSSEAASPAPAARLPAPQATAVVDLPEGNSVLTNLADLVAQRGLGALHARGEHGQGVKVAVFDNGFAGLTQSLGVRLPPETQVQPAPLDNMADTTHGVKLAEIVYALATGQATYSAAVPGPEILLFNTNGFSNFQAAVTGALAAKVDIILYAQVWTFGGDFDGHGFINREVDRATAAGILWVNAAGNFGQSTFDGPVVAAPELVSGRVDLKLPAQDRYVRMVVAKDKTPVTLTLAWNDFSENKTYRTRQDLDLIVENASHQVVAASRLKQTGETPKVDDPSVSAHAREQVEVRLNAGTYLLRVERRSDNFGTASRLRLAAMGEGVTFTDGTPANSLMIPADNRKALTVGASDDGTSGRRTPQFGLPPKPELAITSLVTFSDGEQHRGTSAASAIVAGTLVVLRRASGPLTPAAAAKAVMTLARP